MSKSDPTAKLADMNNPAPKTGQSAKDSERTSSAKDRRTVAPTPEAEKPDPGAKKDAKMDDTQKDDAQKDDANKDNDQSAMADAADAVRGRVKETAEQAQNAAADRAEQSAEQIDKAGDAFDPGSFAQVATQRIADNLGHAAETMRDADFKSLQEDLTEFARRQPLMFFGGAALLGFAAARMLKASAHAEDEADHAGGHDTGHTAHRTSGHGYDRPAAGPAATGQW